MVHFPGFASPPYGFRWRYGGLTRRGFPHSEIPGSQLACSSPRLIAAGCVLLRLFAPRHPPYALSSLTIKFTQQSGAGWVARGRNCAAGNARPLGRPGRNCAAGNRQAAENWAALRKTFVCRLHREFAARLCRFRGDVVLPVSIQLSKNKGFWKSEARSQKPDNGAGFSLLWWAWVELNHRPHPYQGCALAN